MITIYKGQGIIETSFQSCEEAVDHCCQNVLNDHPIDCLASQGIKLQRLSGKVLDLLITKNIISIKEIENILEDL